MLNLQEVSQENEEQKLRKLNNRIYNANYTFEFLVTAIEEKIMLLSKEGNWLALSRHRISQLWLIL